MASDSLVSDDEEGGGSTQEGWVPRIKIRPKSKVLTMTESQEQFRSSLGNNNEDNYSDNSVTDDEDIRSQMYFTARPEGHASPSSGSDSSADTETRPGGPAAAAATVEDNDNAEDDDEKEDNLEESNSDTPTSTWDPTASPSMLLTLPLSRKRKSESDDCDSDETHFTDEDEDMIVSEQKKLKDGPSIPKRKYSFREGGGSPTASGSRRIEPVSKLATQIEPDLLDDATCFSFTEDDQETQEYSHSQVMDEDWTQTSSEDLMSDCPTMIAETSMAQQVPPKVEPDLFDDDGSSTDSEFELKQEEDENQEEEHDDEQEEELGDGILQEEEEVNNLDWTKQKFYGNADRTIAWLAASLQKMPKPEDNVKLRLPSGLVRLFDHQRYALRWMLWREGQFPSGGILADEMGLGKTTSIIALIMKSKMDAPVVKIEDQNPGEEDQDRLVSGATLIICPTGCLGQWETEIRTKGSNLTAIRYHGPRTHISAHDLAQADVVLSTYGTVAGEIPTVPHGTWVSPLKIVQWTRIVLDEAHYIRNPDTAAAIALCKLDARYRWAVTGTPVHNRPMDLYSLVKFLRMAPFDDSEVWKIRIGLKTLNLSPAARRRLQKIASALILRRTKDEVHKAGGNVRRIPPKMVEVVEIELPEKEESLYQTLMTYSKQIFKKFLVDRREREKMKQRLGSVPGRSDVDKTKGKREVGFMHILALVTRLRQCSVHPSLLKTMLEDEEEAEVSQDFNEDLEEHIVSKRNPLIDDSYESAKFKKIFEDLEDLRQQAKMEGRSSMDKVIIVSSWTSLLKILNEHLKRRNFTTVFITGQQTSELRSEAQKAFNGADPTTPQILLLSLMAGGVGLNLVGGNHVFFVEPHWNPQIELQAQDRVHRFGQTKDVFIRRYISTGSESIENRIMELQEMKKKLAESVLDSKKKAEKVGAGLSLSQVKHLFDITDKDLLPDVKKNDDGIWY